MIRLRPLSFLLLLILLTSCGPGAAPVSTAVSAPSATPIPHATEIRFGLIGQVTDVNVWALFDKTGYSYNNYAVRSDYWPRLYRLSVPGRQFEPLAASGSPSSFQQEGAYYVATVSLRTDLNWTDGSPLTADDVAFTADTVLMFQLGFDWHDAYNSAWLDHVVAIDSHTAKFYFKQRPNVGVWQYGILQAPIVQKDYWAPRVMDAAASLPTDGLAAQIQTLKAKVGDLQKNVDALSQALASSSGGDVQQTKITLNRQSQKLDQAIADLAQARSDFDNAMESARATLYALPHVGEPTLGTWMPGTSRGGFIVNDVNAQFPQAQPNFDQVLFRVYPDEESALQGVSSGDVNAVLTPNGLSLQGLSQDSSSQHLMTSPTHALRFLVFNPLVPVFSDLAVRQALACVVDQDKMIAQMGGVAIPLKSYVLPAETFWYNPDARLPCQSLDASMRLAQAVQLLKTEGYAWNRDPTVDTEGEGLTLPNGDPFPTIHLMTPAADTLRSTAASYIQQQARELGIPLVVQSVTTDSIDYAVFSSHRYDMALLGWKVSAYPGYLCEWFGDGNPFGYDESRLSSGCSMLVSNADLGVASQQVAEIQVVLAQELPFIPLYADVTVDVYQNITYPFPSVVDGLSGIYGGPTLAIPAAK